MTSIEWTDRVWNPTTGCDRVSPGCDNCYAMTMAKRLKAMGQAKYQRDGDPRTSGPGFGLTTHDDVLTAPLRWRKPARVFVNSMSDLFHDDVPDEFIARVFAVMATTPQHTYQVLTKRHGRLRSLLNSGRFGDLAWKALHGLLDVRATGRVPAAVWDTAERRLGARDLRAEPMPPLPNVWLGVSVEDQQWADIRIPALLDTPAAVRWVSAEPLLGPVDLGQWLVDHGERGRRWGIPLSWVVCGGESGPGARSMHPDWARSLRDQCTTAVPFFFKQWGGATPKAGGRMLDGRTWDEYPQPLPPPPPRS